MRSVSRWAFLGLALTSGLPRCACDETDGLRRAQVELLLTFLDEDSCSGNVVRRRIPDDYEGALRPVTDFASRGERVFELRSTGEVGLLVEEVRLSQDDPEFSLTVTDAEGEEVELPRLIPPARGGPPGLVLTVRYSAFDAEPDRLDLVVVTDDPDRSEVRFGLAAGRGRLSVCVDGLCDEQAAVDFGPVDRGTAASREIVLENVGDGPLDLRSVRLASDSGEFCAPEATELPDGLLDCTLIPQCLELLPGEQYVVRLTYRPVDGGEDSAELVIVSGDAAAGNVVVPITGLGAGPALCVCAVEGDGCEPAPVVDFGLAPVGGVSERAVRLLSCGTAPVTLSEATLERSANHPFFTGTEFEISSPFALGPLPPGATSEAVIRYSPTVAGRHRGGLRYRSAESPLDSWVGLVGRAATCELQAVPDRLGFGTIAGGQSRDRSVLLINIGNQACEVLELVEPSAPFAIVNAPGLPAEILPGSTLEVPVRFSPPAGPVQNYTGQLEVRSSAPGASNLTIDLRGDGGGVPVCSVEVAPSFPTRLAGRDGLLNFGAVNVGYTQTLPIRIRNVGSADCTLASFRLNSLLGRRVFQATSTQPVPLAIPPGAQTEVRVSFAPTSASDLPFEPITNSVDLRLSGPDLAQTDWSIGILARATVPSIDVIPRDLDFGEVTWERPSAPDNRSACGSRTRTVSVYNSGSGPLTITGIEIDRSSDPVFEIREVRQGGRALPAPYAGISVGGGSSIEVDLRFFPTRADPSEHRGLLVVDNDVTNPMGNGAPFTVPLTGAGTANPNQIDRFEQLVDNKVDVLWVIDDSCSMQSNLNQVSANFRSFVGFADSLGVDYQIGVTTTEVRDANTSGVIWGCSGFNRIIRSSDPDRFAAFECASQVMNPPNGNRRPNPGGSDVQEAGLQAARIALDVPNVTGANAGFLRSDARLSVVVVSDEDDQSDGPVSLYVDFFRTLKGFRNQDLVQLSSIAGDVPNGCATADAGRRYAAAVSALGGQFESICSRSWATMLQNLGLGSFALRRSWGLSRPADPATLQVTVNGQVVAESGSNGYTHDAASDSILFHGAAVPPPGARIEVRYRARCLP